MNILFLLTPKASVEYLYGDFSIRQALEKMEYHRYTVIPVLDRASGAYLYSLAEGDILYYLKTTRFPISSMEKHYLTEIKPNRVYQVIGASQEVEDIYPLIVTQNFVPVVDDRGTFMGIITRKAVVGHLLSQKGQ
jgi:CBS domain-containing protein